MSRRADAAPQEASGAGTFGEGSARTKVEAPHAVLGADFARTGAGAPHEVFGAGAVGEGSARTGVAGGSSSPSAASSETAGGNTYRETSSD